MCIIKGAWRILLTALVSVGLMIAAFLLNQIAGLFNPDTDLLTVFMVPILFALVVCVINQVLYEVLDWAILDNIVGRVIKTVVYIVSMLLVLIFEFAFVSPEFGGSDMAKPEGLFGGIFYYACICSGNVTMWLWCKIIEDEEDEGFYFVPAIAVAYSLVIGVVMQILSYIFLPGLWAWVAFLGTLAFVVLTMISNGVPYTDSVGTGWFRSWGSKGSSSSSSYSGSSSGYKSGSSSSSSGYRSSSSSGRTVDNYGQLESRMKSIASRNSGTQYVYAGTKLFINVRASVVGTQITFTISAEYGLMSNVQQSDISYISDDIQRVLRETRDSVLNEADSEIDELREQYTNYDKDYNIATRGGDIKKAY